MNNHRDDGTFATGMIMAFLMALSGNQSEKGSPLAALHEVFDVIKIQVQGARR
jgi:hypothetical protein